MKRSTASSGVALAAVSVLASTALMVGPAGAAPTVSDPIATHLAGPLQMDVEGDRVVVAQNFTGVLSEVNPDGSTTELATQKSGEVAGVAINGDTVAFTSSKHTHIPVTFLKVVDGTGAVSTIANLYNYESDNNPDGNQKYGFRNLTKSCKSKLPRGFHTYKGIIDSHPYALADAPDGGWYVAEAAGNDILKVSPSGDVSTVAVLAPQEAVVSKAAAKSFGLPACVGGKSYAFEPVPTDVEVDGTGQLVVSLLPGGPEDASLGARGAVVRIDPLTGDESPVADGFAGATNVAVDGDTIYVSELFGGKVSEIALDGSTSTFYEAKQPAAMEFANGQVYLAIKALNQKNGGSIVTITPEPAT